MEADEIQEFTKSLEEGKEARLTYVSLAISILAVLVAMVTVLGHRSHTEAVLMQSRAADQWNEYQAKKIRQAITEKAADLLSLQPSSNDAKVQAKLGEYKHYDDKAQADLAEEQKKAHEFEDEVHTAEAHAGRYDLGEALLQIAVVMSSITLLTRQRLYFLFGLTLGLCGIAVVASVFFLR